MITLSLFALISAFSVAQSSRCVQGENCRLPNCFCPTFQHPVFQDIKDIPQMVYFGFDDALHSQVDRYYRQLFTKDHRNPNGCPISMSLYVQDKWTSYEIVDSYHRRGMEIGSHSVTHTDITTKQKLQDEAGKQKDNLAKRAHIPTDQIVGWRSPNLKTAGDVQPDVLKSLGYTYDISLTYTRHRANDPIPWPYTLDFGYPYGCSVPPCPRSTSHHPGFWEVPVPSLYNPESGYPCAYVDSCRPSDEAAAEEYLWSNFDRVYKGNRAPFGLNMHAAWFYNAQYMRAAITFVERLLKLPDVYVLNVGQVLAWMKNPVKISDIGKLSEWSCAEATPNRNTIRPHLVQKTGTTYPPWRTQQPRITTHTSPFRTYRPPSRTYRPPNRTYRPPNRTYRPPNRTYRPPSRTYRPPSITYRPPNRTYRPPSITYRPPNRTYRPPSITYRPPNRTYRPPNRTYRPPGITYRPTSRTYRPPNRTYRPPSITYRPTSRTYPPPNRTYRPPSITYRPTSRTYRPPNRTYRPPGITYPLPGITYRPLHRTTGPPNSIFRLPLSFIPVPSGQGNSGASGSNLGGNTGSVHQNMHSYLENGAGNGGQNSSWNLQGSEGERHKGSTPQPSPVLIKLNYHFIDPPHGNNNHNVNSNSNNNNNNDNDNNSPKEEANNKGGEIFGVEKDGSSDGQVHDACVQEVTCSLPTCACRSLRPPAKLGVENTPQIVYLTFTGPVNGLNYQRVLSLLTSRKNPNNCPISATFFVPLAGNYEPYVQSLRSRGHEIAMYGSDPYMFNHWTSVKQQMQSEVETFRSHERSTGLNSGTGTQSLGYRSPDGTSLGNGMIEGLQAGKIVYDASLVTSRQAGLSDVIPWPYTLDYSWKDCQLGASQCLSGRYPGLWEVPFVSLVDTKKHATCTYADGCHNHPASSGDVSAFLMDNLRHALRTNRAPMGLHLRYEWFSDPLFYSNLQGLQIFLDAILGPRDDVFVMSVEKMLDWMRSPVGLDRIESFGPWKC